MLDGKKISCFESNKFIEVNKAVKEDAYLLVVLFEFVEVEVTFLGWLYHVVHLTEQVDKENRLVVQILQSVYLLFVEILHFVWSDDLITI